VWADGELRDILPRAGWNRGTPRQSGRRARWGTAQKRDDSHTLRWDGITDPRDVGIEIADRVPDTRDWATDVPYGSGVELDAERVAAWQEGTPLDRATQTPWGSSEALDRGITVPLQHGIPLDRGVVVPWGPSQAVPPVQTVIAVEQEDAEDEIGPPDQVPELETYTVPSSVVVRRVSDQSLVQVISAAASYSMGDFAWSVQLAIADQASFDLIDPSNGAVEIDIEINGRHVLALAERWNRQKVFGKSSWVIRGRGVSAELDEPYLPAADKLSTSLASAAQHATDELSGTGWSLNWLVTDWNLDTGEYFYQQLSPIRAIAKLAATPGAWPRPESDARLLKIVSRLPFKPANWADNVDVILPESAVIDISDDCQPRPEYNYVQISGGTQGVTVEATKSGTAGDEPAPDIVDEFLTDSSVVTQDRGRVELYGSGPSTTVVRQAPIIDSIIPLPGEIVQNNDAGETWHGLCTAIAIRGAWVPGKGLQVWQDYTQERR